MIDVVFAVGLYVLGLFVSSAFFHTIKTPFLAWTAFLWGGAIWTFGGVISMMLVQRFAPEVMLLWCSLLIIVASFIHIKHPRKKINLRKIIPIILFFVFSMIIVSLLRFADASYDSVAQIIISQLLAEETVQADTLQALGAWGPMLLFLYGAGFWAGQTIYMTIQSAFVWSLIGTLGYLSHSATKHSRSWIPLLVVFMLTYFIVFQAAYIHNSILAASYLLPAVVLVWMALVEDQPTYLYPAWVLFTGFAFARTESVLFVVPFIIMALSYNRFSARTWTLAMIPYALLTISWQLWLLFIVKPDSAILTTERVILLLLAIFGTLLSPWILQNVIWLRLYAHRLFIGGMVLVISILILISPNHMLLNIINSFSNLTLGGVQWWGLIWWIIILMSWQLRKTNLSYGIILSWGVVGFIMLLMIVGIARQPYRLGWGDSANRIFTHILPILVFYTILKIDKFWDGGKQNLLTIEQSQPEV